MKHEEPTLSVAETRRIVGVAPGTFQMWMNRGHIPFVVTREGHRTRRRFTLDQVRQIAVIGELNDLGLPIELCAAIANNIIQHLADKKKFAGRYEFAGRLLVTRDESEKNAYVFDAIYELDDIDRFLADHVASILVDADNIEKRLAQITEAAKSSGRRVQS